MEIVTNKYMHTLVLKEVKWDIGPKGTERCANKIGGGIFLSYPPLLANAVKPRGGSGENFERNPATRGLPRVGQGRHPRRIAQLLVTTGGNVGLRGHGPRDYEGDGASCPDFLASPEWPARRNLRISFLTPSPRDFHLTLDPTAWSIIFTSMPPWPPTWRQNPRFKSSFW